MRPNDLPSIETLGNRKPHGTRLRYLAGCRCLICRAANARYAAERGNEIRKGNWNGLVPASRARRHLMKLSRAGVGRRSIADAAGLPESTITKIKRKERKQIRAATERAILSVTKDALPDSALIPAARTWALIRKLFSEGFTEAQLALKLGYKTPKLQISKERITAKTAMKIERFYRLVMEG